jgi:predicted nucleic acid-binding protein
MGLGVQRASLKRALPLMRRFFFLSANIRLPGLGIGYIDAHLLAAAQLTPDASLWTHDKRLAAAARTLTRSFQEFAASSPTARLALMPMDW